MIADLVGYLGQTTAVSNIVAARIYPDLPQSPTLPALTFSEVSSTRTYALEGDLHKARSRFQIDSWATTQKAAYQLADAVRHTLSGFQGSMNGTQVHCITLDNQFRLFENEAGTVGIYRVLQDYIISYLEN